MFTLIVLLSWLFILVASGHLIITRLALAAWAAFDATIAWRWVKDLALALAGLILFQLLLKLYA